MITIVLLLFGLVSQIFIPSSDVAEFNAGFGDELFYDEDLAKQFAPFFYHQISIDELEEDLGYSADFMTNVNFDGDWKGDNNWDNLQKYSDQLSSYVYYWGFERDDFTFLGYMIFHPRDWSNQLFGNEHENDMEGVFVLLTNDTYGNKTPISISTIAHSDIKHYKLGYLHTADQIASNDKFSGHVQYYKKSTSPVVYVESGGHGIYGAPKHLKDPSNRNYLRYMVGDEAENPADINIEDDEIVKYKLLPIKELWDKREDRNLFSKSGYVKSDLSGTCGLRMLKLRTCKYEAALPPWLWSQGQSYPGELWYEPIELLYNLLDLEQIFG